MISNILNIMQRGLGVMRSNSRIMLVGILLFVFPILFVWVTQSFFTSASDNIKTAQNQRIGMLHDTLTAILQSGLNDRDLIVGVTRGLAADNLDISTITIYQDTDNGFQIYSSIDTELLDTFDPEAVIISDIGFSDKLNFQQFEYKIAGKRVWQSFRRVAVENDFFYIFTEYDLSTVDATMKHRQQQSYLSLTVIFIFIIMLAYWLNRQVFWERHHSILVRQLEERDMFSNMIAHEFRTPLTAIKGYASFLQESERLSAEESKFADNIRSSAEGLVTLVSDFLEVARLQSGKLKIEQRDLDVRTVLTAVVTDLQGEAKKKGLELRYVSSDVPVPFKTDPDRLTQVITNLISNAIKYTEKGYVELEMTDTRAGIDIRIKDTGMGISANDQQKLFAPFTRVGGVDETNITGTGLGMWITKQLVSVLGGTIGVESITGVGTHVVINFKDQ